jgi:hypothetical protein
VSVTFAGTILAAITFMLGFAFSSDKFPALVRALLLGSTLATTISLVVYTNSSGEIARLRTNGFNLHMRVGNVLSEFGGLYPFLVALPITFAHITMSESAGLAAGGFFVVSLVLYEISRFSIGSRLQRSPHRVALLALALTGPLTGVLAVGSDIASWVWTVGITVVLTSLGISYLRDPAGEQNPDPNSEWHIRH